jgi:hypothetical protein
MSWEECQNCLVNCLQTATNSLSQLPIVAKLQLVSSGLLMNCQCKYQLSGTTLTLRRTTVAIFSYEDRMSIHRQKADEAFLIGNRGQYTPVGAYVCTDDVGTDQVACAR